MKKLFDGWPRRLLGLAMSLVMSVGLLFPAASLAAVDRTLDGGGLDRRGGEGDPLDSNDHGGSGSGGDVVHSDGAGGLKLPVIPSLLDGKTIVLIPEFQSGTLVFRILVVDTQSLGSEE